MELIKAINVNKKFGNNHVLRDVSMRVNEGEVVAIIGPSGSGKSTFLRCLNQLEQADSGTIEICSEKLLETVEGKAIYAKKKQAHDIQLKTGLVFQKFCLFPHMSVMENIANPQTRVLGTKKEVAEQKAIELLAKMDLSDKLEAYPYQLSGGQQQRVAIARALALNPKVLFFDEPTSALDPQLTGEILKVIKALADDKMTMVVVTHEMNFARGVANRVIFMADGEVIEEGTPEEVFDNAKSDRIKEFLSI